MDYFESYDEIFIHELIFTYNVGFSIYKIVSIQIFFVISVLLF